MGLLILSLIGCAGKYDPYRQQVQRAAGLSRQGEQSFSEGDLNKASKSFSRALDVSRSVDYPPGEAQQLNNLGAVALEQGDLKQAAELFTRCQHQPG
jgi:Tfp pilus assembly protein PilF